MKRIAPIILTFEGFTPAALSCFGSSWNKTPVIDSIAATGVVWDRCLTASDDPDKTFHRFAEHLLDTNRASEESVELITDVPSIAETLAPERFDRVDLISSGFSGGTTAQNHVAETQLGQLFAAAIERQSDAKETGLMWIHSGFLTQSWDAPRDAGPIEQADLAADQVDHESDEANFPEIESPPPVFETIAPPGFELTGNEHPDFVSSWMRTYACQIRMIDSLLELLLNTSEDSTQPIILAGTSGYRLGQSGWVGHRLGPLHSRDVHVPVICGSASTTWPGAMRIPWLSSSQSVADEIRLLVSDSERPSDQVADSCRTSIRDPSRSVDSDRIKIESIRSSDSLATDDWFYVRDEDGGERLYSKPDDIDDFNDVARVRPDIVGSLRDS